MEYIKGLSKSHIEKMEDATREYKNNLNSPELLTQFMCAFWQEAGQKIGKHYIVSKFPLKSKEIEERGKNSQIAIFVPEGVNRVDLGKIFPRMKNWAVQEGNSVIDTINNFGWLWIESSVDAPNLNTTQGQLEGKFEKEKRQGQSLRTFIVGGQINKLLTDKYFNEGPTWSRLLGSCSGSLVLGSFFDPVGGLDVYSLLDPEGHSEHLGGRSEEMIQPRSEEPQINHFFKAISGKTKEIKVSWHDYEDGRSLQQIIHIPIDQDTEVGATSFLMKYVSAQYDFESAKERWKVEIGPVFEGPGPGDGSDASFDIITFDGTKEEAEAKGKEMTLQWEEDNGTLNRDRASYSVGFSVLQKS